MAQAGDEPTTMEPQSDYTLRPPYRANIETVDSYTVSSEGSVTNDTLMLT